MLLQTQNISLSRITVTSDDFIFELLNTPNWKKFIGERNINSRQDAVNYIINGPQKLYEQYGYGLWLVTLTDSDKPIGMCGLLKRDYLDRPDLGFALLPQYEGRGLAYEASVTVIKYAKSTYAIDKLYATTMPDNLRSRRLLERCGFVQHGVITTPEAETLLLYVLIL